MVTVEQILDTWGQSNGQSVADHCLDLDHPLGVFSSVDGDRPSFLIVSPVDPRDYVPLDVDAIRFEVSHRQWDDQWVCSFVLLNPRLDIAFAELVSSLVNHSANAASALDAMRIVGASIQELQLLFAVASRKTPSMQELRGIFAEMWFLCHHLAPSVGVHSAVKSWTGPLGATHDFNLPDSRMIEVKSRRWNHSHIKISSPGQLSIEHGDLVLAIVAFDDSEESAHSEAPLTIGSLQADIVGLDGATAATASLLQSRLGSLGIDVSEGVYQDTYFTTPEVRTFRVTELFPRLRLEHIPPGVSRISYQLDVGRLNPFEIDWLSE